MRGEGVCVINAVSVVHIDADILVGLLEHQVPAGADYAVRRHAAKLERVSKSGCPTQPRAGTPTRRIYGVLEPVNAISDAGTPKREIARLSVVSVAAQLPRRRDFPRIAVAIPLTSACPTRLDVISTPVIIGNIEITKWREIDPTANAKIDHRVGHVGQSREGENFSPSGIALSIS